MQADSIRQEVLAGSGWHERQTMKLLHERTLDEVARLTRGVFRFRELWLRETTVAGSRWQRAHLRREIITGGGRTLCTLTGDGSIIPDDHARRKYAGDAGNPEVTCYGDPGVCVERLDDHLYRVKSGAAARRAAGGTEKKATRKEGAALPVTAGGHHVPFRSH